MKKTLFLVVLVMLLVTLACGSTDTTTDDSTIGSDVVTAVPEEVEPVPLDDTTTYDSPWYLEEFDTNLDNWNEQYLSDATDEKYDSETAVYLEDGGVWFDINLPDTYIYLFNENYSYDDVAIEFEVENTGPHNSQYINPVCRYTPGKGWYEFSVAASGKVQLWRYDFDDGYILIDEGGSTNINQGNATNNYKMTCIGNELSLYINGKLWRSAFKDSNLREGYIGISAGTMNVYPIQVVFNWVEISEP
ncbi:MAG: hypothetical protein JW704_04625 [Anaerolineaceae bacterium]|nr:hypothetical protein [Anaerolineaceae bacterium]MBN2678566.1 hypothetical protein [Anaerolineaceae bacterium]